MVRYHSKKRATSRNVLIMASLTFAGLIIALLTWDDVVRQRPDGEYELSEEWEAKRQKEHEHVEDCETYLLVALVNGWYTCYLCPGGKYYLYAGETWKIGHTCYTPRYKQAFLKKEKVAYVRVKTGDYQTCRKLEIDLIASFPLSEQNLKRDKKDRLVVPPGHRRQNLK